MRASRRRPGRAGQSIENREFEGRQSTLAGLLLQLAWLWLRHQPDSVLSQWFQDRVKANGGRLKKPTIVALARKLLVALWKYVTSGVVIEGAIVRAV